MQRVSVFLLSSLLLSAASACSDGANAGTPAGGMAGTGRGAAGNPGASTSGSGGLAGSAGASEAAGSAGSVGLGPSPRGGAGGTAGKSNGGTDFGGAGGASSTPEGGAAGAFAAGSGGGGSGGAAGESAGAGAQAGSGGGNPVDPSTLPKVTLHLAGDSTVMTYDAGSAQEGWGQELGQFFDEKVKIDNQAIGGASVRTFQTGRWTNIVSALEPGDYVMIQFGTNDSGTVEGRHVDPPDFTAALGEMIDEVEAKQGTVILVTPSALQEWSGGKEGNARLGPYAQAMSDLGPARGVLVDDLNARSVEYLNQIGQQAATQIYIDGDKAHFTKMGATQMAQFVAEELARIGSPLAGYLAR